MWKIVVLSFVDPAEELAIEVYSCTVESTIGKENGMQLEHQTTKFLTVSNQVGDILIASSIM